MIEAALNGYSSSVVHKLKKPIIYRNTFFILWWEIWSNVPYVRSFPLTFVVEILFLVNNDKKILFIAPENRVNSKFFTIEIMNNKETKKFILKHEGQEIKTNNLLTLQIINLIEKSLYELKTKNNNTCKTSQKKIWKEWSKLINSEMKKNFGMWQPTSI